MRVGCLQERVGLVLGGGVGLFLLIGGSRDLVLGDELLGVQGGSTARAYGIVSIMNIR